MDGELILIESGSLDRVVGALYFLAYYRSPFLYSHTSMLTPARKRGCEISGEGWEKAAVAPGLSLDSEGTG